jgi:hypothetical protein
VKKPRERLGDFCDVSGRPLTDSTERTPIQLLVRKISSALVRSCTNNDPCRTVSAA